MSQQNQFGLLYYDYHNYTCVVKVRGSLEFGLCFEQTKALF